MKNIGCWVSLIIAFSPRLVFLLLWVFTPRVNLAFDGWLLPLLGLAFLPFTTLAYVLVWTSLDGVSGAGWLLVIGGLLFDLGTYAIGALVTRSRRQSHTYHTESINGNHTNTAA